MAYFGVTATSAGLQAAAGGDLAGGLRRRLDRVPPGAPIVVLVHGWKFHPAIPGADPHRSLFGFRDGGRPRAGSWPEGLGIADDDGESGLAIGFGWPACAPHLSSLLRRGRTGFAEVYERAGEAGAALAVLVTLVQALAPGRAVDVLAHSLGARVALAALPHLDRAPERMILLGAAELASRARAFVTMRRGDAAPAIYNVTARSNDPYDLAFECFVPGRARGERAVGAGVPGLACWLDLQIDRSEVTAWATAQGVALRPETARCCHRGFYTREGALTLYQAILRRQPGWDLAGLRAVPCFAAQEPRWSRLLPSRRPDLPRLDGGLAGMALEG